jgi:hypothetical protein
VSFFFSWVFSRVFFAGFFFCSPRRNFKVEVAEVEGGRREKRDFRASTGTPRLDRAATVVWNPCSSLMREVGRRKEEGEEREGYETSKPGQ